MTMYTVFYAVSTFLRILGFAIFAYWLMTLLRFNNRFVQLLARFIYPFVAPFRRPAMWVTRRTGWPVDFTLWFSMLGMQIAGQLLWTVYYSVLWPLGLR